MKKKNLEKFNYAVGSYWKGEDGAIGVYYYGSAINYGTIKDAEEFLKYVESKGQSKTPYKIFMLVEVPQ